MAELELDAMAGCFFNVFSNFLALFPLGQIIFQCACFHVVHLSPTRVSSSKFMCEGSMFWPHDDSTMCHFVFLHASHPPLCSRCCFTFLCVFDLSSHLLLSH